MSGTLVIFRLGDRKFAISVEDVERVIRAVEITPLPDSASELSGIINIEGEIVEVVNLRQQLGFGDRQLELQDHIVIAADGRQRLAFVVDAVEQVMHYRQDQLAKFDRQKCGASGTLKLDEGIIMLFNFLDVAELSGARQLQSA